MELNGRSEFAQGPSSSVADLGVPATWDSGEAQG